MWCECVGVVDGLHPFSSDAAVQLWLVVKSSPRPIPSATPLPVSASLASSIAHRLCFHSRVVHFLFVSGSVTMAT